MKASKYLSLTVLLLWMSLTACAWFLPAKAESDAERRPLKQFPQTSVDALLRGQFMSDFEGYTLDQFPLRDSFRAVKAMFHTYVLGEQDTNGIYVANGYAAKMEHTLNKTSLDHIVRRLTYVKDKYLTDSKVYMAIVPDKGHYLAENSGRLSLDYDGLYAHIQQGMPWAEHIDLRDTLSLQDYYRTDTHWRQENLIPAAGVICEALGVSAPREEDYDKVLLDRPFYGVYWGQAALPMEPESMYIMESELLEQCTVYDYETGKNNQVYDWSKYQSRDLYDVYLSGARALLTIQNPAGIPGKELIVFRDSFGSSMIPLLVQDYETVTVVDIRYIGIDLLDRFVDFHGQDVLMLYSTLILNNSSAIK